VGQSLVPISQQSPKTVHILALSCDCQNQVLTWTCGLCRNRQALSGQIRLFECTSPPWSAHRCIPGIVGSVQLGQYWPLCVTALGLNQ
jgi:hypothetical protein